MGEEHEKQSLDSILTSLPQLRRDGKINLYLLHYEHIKKQENYSITLPSNHNSKFLEEYSAALEKHKDFTCVKYDPVEHKAETYEYLPLDSISNVWTEIMTKIEETKTLKESPHRDSMSISNLSICKLLYGDREYWLGTQQKKEESLFKGKIPFLNDEGKLKQIKVKNLLALSFQVDFVICDYDTPVVYVLNRGAFESVFHFYDLLKEHVKAKSEIIAGWSFLENASLIQEKIETGYVFKGLARIIDDDEYLKLINETEAHVLKKRLLEKCVKSFSEKDFDGDKLKVTKSNLKNVIRMLSKGFKYNFFSDKAEE